MQTHHLGCDPAQLVVAYCAGLPGGPAYKNQLQHTEPGQPELLYKSICLDLPVYSKMPQQRVPDLSVQAAHTVTTQPYGALEDSPVASYGVWQV